MFGFSKYFAATAFTLGISCTARESARLSDEFASDAQFLSQLEALTFKETPKLSGRDLELAAWGKRLFFDPRFSRDGKTACATCHRPDLAFTDGEVTPRNHPGVQFNTPTLANAFASAWFFWDGRADSLAAQARAPLQSPDEMDMQYSDVAHLIGQHYRSDYERFFGVWPERVIAKIGSRIGPLPPSKTPSTSLLQAAVAGLRPAEHSSLMKDARLNKMPEYRLFSTRHLANVPTLRGEDTKSAAAYSDLEPLEREALENSVAAFALAIAAYERTLVATAAPFDHFVARMSKLRRADAAFGDGFSADEWEGYKVFVGAGRCILCHRGPTFSDGQFHNTGFEARTPQAVLGRALGLQIVLSDPWNCQGHILPKTATESCSELEFLNREAMQALGAFKTPTLRNVGVTGPYGHDGRFSTLGEVLMHYNELATYPLIGHREATLRRLGLDSSQLRKLEAFLLSLTSPVSEVAITVD